MGGRGGSSGSKGIGGVGLDVTYNGETTRYYFERHGNQNYYSTGMGGNGGANSTKHDTSRVQTPSRIQWGKNGTSNRSDEEGR